MSSHVHDPVLRPEDHEFFLEHGFIVLENAVPPDTMAAAVAALEAGSFTGHVGAADYRPVVDRAIEECVTPTVLDAIGELFGPAYPFDRTPRASDMPRPYEPDVPWTTQVVHVDDDYPTLMPAGWALGMFIFLTPVRSHGGAFLYASGSPYRYRPLLADNAEWLSFFVTRPDLTGEARELLAEPGDVLLFHHCMAHAGSKNVSDPRTRHALLHRWHPTRRIVPGNKAFEDMTTIEKANSARYLQQRFRGTANVPAVPRDTRALQQGFGGASDSIAAYTVLRADGATHLFYTDDTAPDTIRHAESRDWTDWTEHGTIPSPVGPVASLHTFRREADLLLFVGGGDGTIDGTGDGTGDRTAILASRDLGDWTALATLPASRAGSGHYTTDYGSRDARGKVIFSIAPAAPSTVQARWGDDWQAAATWTGASSVVALSPDREILDALVKPVLGEVEFALVLDVRQRGEDGSTQPYYTISRDSARFDDAVQPIAFTAPTPPRRLRVYARARNYWLVTYLRAVEGRDRLFWGSIDWDKTPLALEEIDSAEALEDALAVVGVR